MSPSSWSKGLVALVAAAAAVVVCVIVSLIVVNTNDDSPKSNDAAATAQQEPAPDYPTFTSPPATEEAQPDVEPSSPSPSPTVTKSKTTPRAKPKGNSPSKGVSACGVRSSKFASYFDDHKVNGALRLELNDGAANKVTLYSSTSVSTSVEHKISDSAGKPNPTVTGVDWVARQSKTGSDNDGDFYRIRYYCNERLKLYGVYYRVGNGEWKLLQYPNDKKFYTGTYYQVVVFWHDPDASARNDLLPPGFSWSSAERPTFS